MNDRLDLQAQGESVRRARVAARRAIIDLALLGGAEVISRPAYPDAPIRVRDVEATAGLRAARAIELGARHVIRDYIREAREAGRTWHEIGAAVPGRRPRGRRDGG